MLFLFISLLAQRNEAKKVHHESQPKAFLGAQAALLCPENFRFAPFVDACPGIRWTTRCIEGDLLYVSLKSF
jgi:hypothetical protein